MKTLQTIQNELRDLIPQGIDLTMAALKKILVPGMDCHSNFILLESRYQEVSRQLLQGIVSNEDATLEFNKIRKDLLDFVNCLKEADLPDYQPSGTAGGMADVLNGEVLYRIPKRMQVGLEEECIVRLAFDRKKIMHDFQVQAGDVMKDLRISDVMGVELLDPHADKAFTITTLNDMVQFVDKDLVTEWIYCVTPLKEGQYPLVLKISLIEIISGIERKRNEVLKEEVIILTQKPSDAMPEFVSAGYSWKLTDSDEQRAVVGGERSGDPAPPPAAPSPGAPTPVPQPKSSNVVRALGLGLIGKVAAGVVALVVGVFAVKEFVAPNTSENPALVDNSSTARIKRMRANPDRRELEAFIQQNPEIPEAEVAMLVLDSLENAAWQSAVAANNSEDLKQYLDEYPAGAHANEAATMMDEMNRGEIVATDSIKMEDIVVKDDVKEPLAPAPRFNPKATAPKPAAEPKKPPTKRKPATANPQNTIPTPKPGPSTAPKPEPPVRVDPNKPVALFSAARRPVFKNCGSSNKEKEEKCTAEKIRRFLKNRFGYPPEAMRKSIEGTVVVTFVVERDGSITEVKALNDIGGGCAKEAERMVSQLPKFKPGLDARGTPLRVQYTQPVRFSLD